MQLIYVELVEVNIKKMCTNTTGLVSLQMLHCFPRNKYLSSSGIIDIKRIKMSLAKISVDKLCNSKAWENISFCYLLSDLYIILRMIYTHACVI